MWVVYFSDYYQFSEIVFVRPLLTLYKMKVKLVIFLHRHTDTKYLHNLLYTKITRSNPDIQEVSVVYKCKRLCFVIQLFHKN